MGKVIKAFLGVKDGEVIPQEFQPGDEVNGDLGAVAVREGWAEESDFASGLTESGADAGAEGEAKSMKAAENKALKSAPENK